jgi:hypothetical protein
MRWQVSPPRAEVCAVTGQVCAAAGRGETFHRIGQAKTGISSPAHSRELSVQYDTAWLLHNKIQRAMSEREAYLGRERPCRRAERSAVPRPVERLHLHRGNHGSG